ncbi:MAG: hypothetical protein CVU81_01880 [Euryarchaeota archaeon HGW-Euryarchaeota-1]|nr:MAG: hypothetical protein CVU81_01880 [Euryarchaeota archaeon HGW-Euryarchaeota-1]
MVKLRRNKTTRTLKRAYARTAKKVAGKAYIKKVPATQVHRYEYGGLKGEVECTRIVVYVREPCVIRTNSIEASRKVIAGLFEKVFVSEKNKAYYIKILRYAHHIVREHIFASGAGADRVSQGMSHSYGKSGCVAIRLTAKNEPLLAIWIVATPAQEEKIVKSIDCVRKKIGAQTYIKVEHGVFKIGDIKK